ncbi:5819_t:CDS:2, partial [Entrophospora sp. SA101]
DAPLRADESLDVLETLKLAGCTFDQNAIALGSTRSYKSSNYLRVETKCNKKWHLEQVCEDGGWHHLYSDLTIKKNAEPNPVALVELIATRVEETFRT